MHSKGKSVHGCGVANCVPRKTNVPFFSRLATLGLLFPVIKLPCVKQTDTVLAQRPLNACYKMATLFFVHERTRVRLELCTWQEVDTYLEQRQAIIVPIGSTEQHGPNGLLGTDSLTAEHIAWAAGAKAEVLVGPTITVGMAQHHLGFPGTVSLRPSTLLALIVDYVRSLTVNGFDRFYFLNGHGGNAATITAAFSELYADTSFARVGANQPTLRLGLQNWWAGPRVRKTSAKHFSGKEGSHATPSEISLTYFLFPEATKNVSIEPPTAPTGRIRDAQHYRARYPDGRIGSDPREANADVGGELFDAAVADVADDCRLFLTAD